MSGILSMIMTLMRSTLIFPVDIGQTPLLLPVVGRTIFLPVVGFAIGIVKNNPWGLHHGVNDDTLKFHDTYILTQDA